MSLQPLLEAPWVVQVHVYAAVAALLLGIHQFTARKGTLPHKTVGFVWILLLFAIVVSSIVMRPVIRPGLPVGQWFGWLHILTAVTLVGLMTGVAFLVHGGPGLKRHARPFLGIFLFGLIGAGAFAVLGAGRVLNRVVFGG